MSLLSLSETKEKEPPVINEEEVRRFRDLGLGRGVDATRRYPWENKSAFQVRRVLFPDLIGTEQGGILQTYEQEVTSVRVQQGKLKSSIAIPHSPVDINLDAEASRSVTNTRRITGKKLTTRTVSFALRFRDRLVDDVVEETTVRELEGEKQDESTTSIKPSLEIPLIFEQRLSNWIINRINAAELSIVTDISKAVETLKSYIDEKDERYDLLFKHCKAFVREFQVTHFVTSIDLGAAEYQVYTEAEYVKKFGSSAGLGVSQIGNVSVSGQSSTTTTSSVTGQKKIGLINSKGLVDRGSQGEAVVGVRLLPITSLLQEFELLHKAMKTAILGYFEKEANLSFGPYIVTCSDKLFWKVNDDNLTLGATYDITEASSFCIFPHDDSGNPDEFMITHSFGNENEEIDESGAYFNLKPVPRYLDTTASFWGYNDGPLKLKYNVNETDSRLVIISRRVENYSPFGLSSFERGEEMFYIKNSRRKWSKDGYLCIKQVGEGESRTLMSGVLPAISYHNDQTIFMLFRLLPASLTAKPDLFWKKISGSKTTHRNSTSTEVEAETAFGGQNASAEPS